MCVCVLLCVCACVCVLSRRSYLIFILGRCLQCGGHRDGSDVKAVACWLMYPQLSLETRLTASQETSVVTGQGSL